MKRDPSLIPLSHQHQHGLALTVQIDRSQPEERENLRLQALELWENELRSHFAAEEQVLFPAVKDQIETSELVDELLDQHRRLEELFGELAHAPQSRVREKLAAVSRLLALHIRAEEQRLFEQVQQALPAQELAELGSRLGARLARPRAFGATAH